jgi:hypothetical protein
MVQSRGNDQELKQCTTNMRKLVSNVDEVLQRTSDDEAHYEGPGQKFYPFSGCSL